MQLLVNVVGYHTKMKTTILTFNLARPIFLFANKTCYTVLIKYCENDKNRVGTTRFPDSYLNRKFWCIFRTNMIRI